MMDPQSPQGRLRVPEEVRKQKRKELDARRSKCRIRIGSHLDQWCVLKQHLGFSLHSQLAKFLLDSYNSSVSMLCTEHRNEDGSPSSFSVTGDKLQQLVILCHDHSQDCGFIPNLKRWTPMENRGRAHALLWECPAGHTISWSLSLSVSQDEVLPTPARKESVPKSADVEVANEQLSISCYQRMLPGQRPRRLRNTVASRRPMSERLVKQRERREAVTTPQSTLNLDENPSVSLERRQNESQSAVDEATTGQSDSSDGSRHASLEVPVDLDGGLRHTDGRHALNRISTHCQWSVFSQNLLGKKLRTELTEVPANHLPGEETADTADSPNAVETAVTGGSVPCSEASPRGFAPYQSLSLEAHEEQGMPEFGLTHEGLQAEIGTDFSSMISAEELEPDEFREYTGANEEDLSNINDLRSENYIQSPISEQRHLRQSDEDLAHIVKKRIRKTAKRDILLCDYDGCGKIFSNRQYLNHHKKFQHVHQNTFVCSEPSCGKSFNFKKHLKEHERRHSDKRDFICEFCARAFRTNSNLIIHRRIHTGEKPIQCEICGFTCRQKASLNWHMKKHDADSFYSFSCDTCGKKFEKRDNVTAHKNKKHPCSSIPVEPHEAPVNEAFAASHGMPLLEAVTAPRDASPPGTVITEP